MFLRLKKVITMNSTSIDSSGRVYATDKPMYEDLIINPAHIVSLKEVEIDGEKHCRISTVKGDHLVVGSADKFLSVDSSLEERTETNKTLLKGWYEIF